MKHRVLAILLILPAITLGQVTFSHPGGFYTDTFSLSMTAAVPTCPIHYTFNGGTPTANDPLYTGPLTLDSNCYSRSNIYLVQNAPDELWYAPDSIEHVIVVRAAMFDSQGRRCSEVTTATYIIDCLIGRHIILPVVSLCIDSLALFDYDTGIFVPGVWFDSNDTRHSGNYNVHGKEWERTAELEIFDTRGTSVIKQRCGLRAHGNFSRIQPQKGMTLYSRATYGSSRFYYRIFDDRQRDNYKRLLLRPFDNWWDGTGIEDIICQRIAEPLLCDNMAVRPVVLFINGEYWGIYFLSEKPDEHYIEEHYNIDNDDVDLIENWGEELENGSAERWEAFYDWLQNADLTDSNDYRYLQEQVDIDALTDYLLMEVFASNMDWPASNTRIWSAPGRKWRWLFYDLDATLNTTYSDDVLRNLSCTDPYINYPTSPKATLLFRKLFMNDNFRVQSSARFMELCDSILSYERTHDIMYDVLWWVYEELPSQFARFNDQYSIDTWWSKVFRMDNHLQTSPSTMPIDYAIRISKLADTIPQNCLYPNPSKGSALLNITAGQWNTINIYNIQGQKVYCIQQNGQSALLLPDLPNGVYIIQTGADEKPLRWIVL